METNNCELTAQTLKDISRSLKEIEQAKTISNEKVKKGCGRK